jgi:chromosome segregation ATPase
MKHIDKIFFVVVLLATGHLCIGNEPNDSPDINTISLMEQIVALELRIDDLEDRISELESHRPPSPSRDSSPLLSEKGEPNKDALSRNSNLSPSTKDDPNKDAMRIERSKKAIQEAKDLISLNETRLKNLPRHYSSSLEDRLNLALDKLELLGANERSYKTIMRYAKTNPELGIDQMKITKKLIELNGEIKTIENKRDDLKEDFSKNHKVFMRSRGY